MYLQEGHMKSVQHSKKGMEKAQNISQGYLIIELFLHKTSMNILWSTVWETLT